MSLRTLAIATALVCLPVSQADALPQPVRPDVHRLDLALDATGKPTEVRCRAETSAAMCATLQAGAARWRFSPALSKGEPIPSEVTVAAELEAVPRPGGFELRALKATTAVLGEGGDIDPEVRRLNAPAYPTHEMRSGLGANVVVELLSQSETALPAVGQVWVNGRPARARDPFALAATNAVQRWQLIPGRKRQKSTCVAVGFSIDRPASSTDTLPCVPTYEAGFTPAVLLTRAQDMSF